MSAFTGLSRRERQIMDILYRRGKASASDVREAMADTSARETTRHPGVRNRPHPSPTLTAPSL